MSKNRRKQTKPALPARARGSQAAKRFTTDSFANFEARVGIGTNNLSAGSGYQFDFITRNRTQLEAMYRSSWIVGQAVDVVAQDMTRAGIDFNSTLGPDEQQAILGAMQRMELWDRLCDTVKWSRLYGGAIAVMLIDGQRTDTPLRLDSIGAGQFKGLQVLDRWQVEVSINDLVQEFGPDLGKPKFYTVVDDSMALRRQTIHHSRVIRMEGEDLPYWQKVSENLWGQSVIERLFDRLVAFDSTTQGSAQLVFKAHLRTYKVKGLREIIATGGPALEALVKQLEFVRRYQSNEGMTLMDADDEFEAHQYAFSGLSDMMLQFAQQLSGALQIPMVRLFGQSPAGLNANGEGDMKQYHEGIAQQQERRLRSGVSKLLDVTCRSELKKPPPKDFGFEFNSLERMSDTQKAEIAHKITTTVTEAYDAGLIDHATGLKELHQSGEVTGVWTNVDDDMIERASNTLPSVSEEDISVDEDARQAPPSWVR